MMASKGIGIRGCLVPRVFLALSLATCGLTFAGDQPQAPDSAVAESLAAWKYFQEVPIAEEGDARLFDFILTPDTFSHARTDLADLRLYDTSGREVPYALRVRRPEDSTVAAKAAPFNQVENADGSSQISLDLGEEQIEHNEVDVKTPGTGFRRHVLVEGSGDREEWKKVAEQDIVRFRAESKEFVDQTIAYNTCRYRYVRITVHADPQKDRGVVKISEVVVRRRVKMPGEFDTRGVSIGKRDPVRADGGDGSAWVIDLGGENVPCDRIMVEIADSEFHRNYHIEAAGRPNSGKPFETVGRGVWQRRAGEKKTDMVARFNDVRAARLKLVVTDGRNAPLQIRSVKVAAPVRAIIVERKAELASPIRLYFGNPKAEAPNYDFARNLPNPLDSSPARLVVGGRQANPAYMPEPLPLTERLPWLIYIVLGAAVAVLLALIASLARAAIAVNDARQAPASS